MSKITNQEKILKFAQFITGENVVQKHKPEEADENTWDMLQKTKPKYGDNGIAIKLPNPISNRSNLAIILENDPLFDTLGYNPHSDQIRWNDDQIRDQHIELIGILLERNYRVKYTDKSLKSAIVRVACENEINPIKDYLDSVKWDGVNRIHNVLDNVYFADYNKEKYSELIKSISTKWFISCVARIYKPGAEVHTCLTLIGEKGIGKGLSIKALAGEENYSNSHIDIGSKSAYEMIHQSGVWIWEIAEMSSMQGKTADTAKAFFTGAWDRYRAAYGHFPINRPRRTVFILSANNYQFLSDGPERRYWPIKIKAGEIIDVQYLADNKDQLWAEAVHRYNTNEKWYLNRDESKLLQEYQEIFIIDDPWADSVKKSIDAVTINSTTLGRAKTSEIMEDLELPIAQQHSGNARRVAQICRDLGYEQVIIEKVRMWRKKQ
jgi:putative DNA primase/helicase